MGKTPDEMMSAVSESLARRTHKIALRGVADVDDQVLRLLRLAYDQNG